MNVTPTAPGLSYVAVPRGEPPSPLRTDVAGFVGRTRRGPVETLTRVEGWEGFTAQFGDVVDGLFTPYAVRGYFENGGEVAHVWRPDRPGSATSTGTLRVGTFDATTRTWSPFTIASHGFASQEYRVDATSPGVWAEGGTVKARFRRMGTRGQPEIDLVVRIDGEPVEYLIGLPPRDLEAAVGARSDLIRLTALGPTPAAQDPQHPGPLERTLATVTLGGGSDGVPASADPALRAEHHAHYLDAVQSLGDETEVALVAAPDLYNDPFIAGATDEIVQALLTQAASLHDRLVLLDSPAPGLSVEALLGQADAFRADPQEHQRHRAGAFYHPWLQIPLDPRTHRRDPFLTLPPSGHVAGVISRLDRERGAHHTPANAPLIEAVDLSACLEDVEQAILHPQGVNLIRCLPGRGLQVWGSRTLDLGDGRDLKNGRFLAHRRLVHRLVRAARRVAEPLVFDVNGPELWLTLVRAITSVLLEAFRAGALLGDRPEEAFYVKCDAQNNPPDQIDEGRCLCEIGVAPARPMEFIVLEVALLANGTLEVIE